jgi:hypothetical protein
MGKLLSNSYSIELRVGGMKERRLGAFGGNGKDWMKIFSS